METDKSFNAVKQLKNVLKRQEKSSNVQNSGVKILNYLINDMLDYASMSSGKFRTIDQNFELS